MFVEEIMPSFGYMNIWMIRFKADFIIKFLKVYINNKYKSKQLFTYLSRTTVKEVWDLTKACKFFNHNCVVKLYTDLIYHPYPKCIGIS